MEYEDARETAKVMSDVEILMCMVATLLGSTTVSKTAHGKALLDEAYERVASGKLNRPNKV